MSMRNLLEIKHLTVEFHAANGALAVANLGLQIKPGQVLGIVGESGSGKSTVGFAIAGLLDPNAARVEGEVFFQDADILSMDSTDLQKIRGSKIGYIFQDAGSALNPLMIVGHQIMQPLLVNSEMDKKTARRRAIELLKMVEIPEPNSRFSQYPHEMSGGMKQRVMIAAALSRSPQLLIADEPTTALDVTVQAQIIDLLLRLKKTLSMSMIFISHDIGLVAQIADEVAVMRYGKIIEYGLVGDVLGSPSEEYTKTLLKSIPKLNYRPISDSRNFWS
jgi:oligopeptide transport system ATP-binding protein